MSPEDGTSGPPPGAASHHQTNPHDRDQVNTDSTAGVRQPAGYAEAYPIYLAGGWPSVLPLKGSTKEPPPGGFTGYKDRYPTHEEMEAWARRFPAGNIALRLPPTVVVLDVDHYGDKHGGDTLAEAERRWGALPPPTATAHGPRHLVTASTASPKVRRWPVSSVLQSWASATSRYCSGTTATRWSTPR